MYNIDKLKDKTYEIDVEIIFEDETIILANTEVVDYTQKNDYLKQLVPITTLTIAVSDYLREKIQKNKDTVKFLISITMDINTTMQKPIFSKYFIPMLDEENVNPYKTTNINNKADKNEAKLDTMTMYIFEETIFNAIKKTFNIVYNNEEMSNMVLYILSQLGLDFLIAPIDRQGIFSEVCIPNLNLKNSILYLQKVYGIFESGCRLYLDNVRSYLLSKTLNNRPHELNEMDTWDVYIVSDMTELRTPSGQYLDNPSKRLVLLGQQKLIKTSSEEYTDSILDGEKVVIQNSSNFNGTTEVNQGTRVTDNSEDNIRVKNYYDPYNNDYNKQEIEVDRYSKTKMIAMPVSNISILDMTPNKGYNFIFDDDLISWQGLYRLDNFDFSINKKQTSNTFKLEGAVAFSKVE